MRQHPVPTRCLAAVLLGVACVAAPRGAAAQSATDLADLSLEDLMNVRIERVYGASRRVQPTTEAPASVTIITAEEIARHGFRTLGEILATVRGFYVTDDRNYSYIGTRGFARPGDYNTRVLLLVDGHRINDSIYDQAPVGRELGLDPATFQRVEIIRGPASALYGTSAFFAVINITTRRGADINGVAVRGGVGTLGRSRVTGQAGRRYDNGLDVSFSAGVEEIYGDSALYFAEFDVPGSSDGMARDMDGESLRTLSGRVSFRDLTITGAFGSRDKTVPTAAYGTIFNDPRFVTEDKRGYVDVALDREWQGSRYSIRGYVDAYHYDGAYPYETEDGGLLTDYGHGAWWGVEGRAARTVLERHTVTGGLEFRDYAGQKQGETLPDDPASTWASDASTHVFGAYLQDEVRVHERLLVNVGGRYDAYAGFNRFTPRAAVVVTPSPTRAFKYLFGTAFRAPNAYELDYLTQGVRNDQLRAETVATNEIVWEEYTGDWMRTSVSGYWSRVANLLSLVEDEEGVLSYTNADRVSARGLELETEVRRDGLQFVASYAWQRTRDRDTNHELTNSPRHLAKARIGVIGAREDPTFAIDVEATGSRLAVSRETIRGHVVAHAQYVHPIDPHITVVAAMRNLFNEKYVDPASEEHLQSGIPQLGRTFYIGLRWTLMPAY